MPATRIAVFPPNNRTGDLLLVSSASALERCVLRTDRVILPDVLASEARLQLEQYGFTVVSPDLVDAATRDLQPGSPRETADLAARAGIQAAALYIDVRRWDPDAPTHPAYVIAAVEATLLEPGTGRVLWTETYGARPVATPGVVVLGDAYVTAARKVMEDLLGSLRPAPGR